MKFKDFEIRPVKSLDGVIDPKRFELVKWYDQYEGKVKRHEYKLEYWNKQEVW